MFSEVEDDDASEKERLSMYHECQSWMHCGVHASNNLMGACVFSYEDFEEYAQRLAPDAYRVWNPHKSCFGMGNYDVNVIEYGLKLKRNIELQWHDSRVPFRCANVPDDCGQCLSLPACPFSRQDTRNSWAPFEPAFQDLGSLPSGGWRSLDCASKSECRRVGQSCCGSLNRIIVTLVV